MRAIEPPTRMMMSVNTDRNKVLQNGTLRTVWTLRAVLFVTLIENIVLFFRGLLPDRALSKAP